MTNPPSRRFARIERDLALKAGRASSRPPSYGGTAGTYISGRGYGEFVGWGPERDYAREVGRIDLNGIVRLCLRWYANAIMQASFRVGRKVKSGQRKGEWITKEGHDLTGILARPSPVLSYRETWTKVIAGFLIDGNAYLIIVRDNSGRPAELWWVPNWQVEIKASGNARQPIDHYLIRSLTGEPHPYKPSDVVHIRDLPDDHNPLVGVGVMKSFLIHLLGWKRGTEYTEMALGNANTGIVLMPAAGQGGMSYAEESTMLGHKARIDGGLARRRGMPVIALTEHVIHQNIGLSPREMELGTITDAVEAYLVAAMGLSALLLDLPSSRYSKTYANKGEARTGAWEDSLLPMLGTIAEAVQDQVLYAIDPDGVEDPEGQFGDGPGLEVWPDTSEVPALQEDRSEKAKLWMDLADSGLCTREYAATQLDIPPEAIPEDQPVPEALGGPDDDDDDEDSKDDPDATDPDADDEKIILASAKAEHLKNCGTGAGGFQPGNDCARGDGSGGDGDSGSGSGSSPGKKNPSSITAHMSPGERAEFRKARKKAASVDADFEARVAKFDAKAKAERAKLAEKLKGKKQADAKLAEFDRQAADLRPGERERDIHVERRLTESYDAISSASLEGRSERAFARDRDIPEPKLAAAARRDAVRSVVSALPERLRDLQELPRLTGHVAEDIYRGKGGDFDYSDYLPTPKDTALYSASSKEAVGLVREAIERAKGRKAKP